MLGSHFPTVFKWPQHVQLQKPVCCVGAGKSGAMPPDLDALAVWPTIRSACTDWSHSADGKFPVAVDGCSLLNEYS